MGEYKQVYKNRAEAYREFIQPQDLPVKRAQFFTDCLDRKMVQPDKTVMLADLLAYAREKLHVAPESGQGMADREHARQMADLEKKERELRVKRLEREEARQDGRTIDIDVAEKVVRRKILIVYERVKAQIRRDQEDMVFRLGLPANKAAALQVEIVGCMDKAFNEMRKKKEFTAMIREDDDAAE